MRIVDVDDRLGGGAAASDRGYRGRFAGGAAFFRHERRLAGTKPITSMSMSTRLRIRYGAAGEQEHEEGEEETGKTGS